MKITAPLLPLLLSPFTASAFLLLKPPHSIIHSSVTKKKNHHKNLFSSSSLKLMNDVNDHDNSFSLDPLSFSLLDENNKNNTNNKKNKSSNTNNIAVTTGAAFMTIMMTSAAPAFANDSPDWGLFEGRLSSMAHPLMMGCLLTYSLYTAYLGFQWRRQREIGSEITDLKKQMPSGISGDLSTAIAAANEAGDSATASSLTSYLTLEQQINDLTAERKELSTQNNRDRHYNQGALLAFLGTVFAIEGPLNTYARAGKLFPGPHLYAGAGLVVCWAAAAACVPAMQKGNDTARSLHIAANAVGIGLFFWQVVSGIPIMTKVWELTHWP